MANKRTRKSKANAHHQFLYSWDQKMNSEARVKREVKIAPKAEIALTTTKRDIVKSLIIASLILSLELVVYLGWIKFLP